MWPLWLAPFIPRQGPGLGANLLQRNIRTVTVSTTPATSPARAAVVLLERNSAWPDGRRGRGSGGTQGHWGTHQPLHVCHQTQVGGILGGKQG